MAKIVKCKTCGGDVADSAKVCPHCGAKIKKPLYQHWWFVVLIIVGVLIVASIIDRIAAGYNAAAQRASSATTTVSAAPTTEREDTSSTPRTEPQEATRAETSELPTIEEQVIYEGHGVTITAKGMEKSGSNWNVNLLIENNSELNLGFNAHAYAVNGIMTRESIYAMDYDVAAGKKVNAQLKLKGSFLRQFDIEDGEIRCVDVLFWAYDNDKMFKEFDTGQLEIKTSLYTGVHDRLVAENVFSESGISVDYVKSENDEYTFVLSNDTGKYVSFTFDEISVNDYTVSTVDYDLYDETLLDGCQILCTVKVKSDFKAENDITTVQAIEWNIELEPENDWRDGYKLGPVVYSVK